MKVHCFLTVASNLDTERILRGGKQRGEQKCAGKGDVGGSMRLIEERAVLIWKTPELRQHQWIQSSKLNQLVKIIVSLWHMCRVWNTTTLLCACLWDTYTSQEEE